MALYVLMVGSAIIGKIRVELIPPLMHTERFVLFDFQFQQIRFITSKLLMSDLIGTVQSCPTR